MHINDLYNLCRCPCTLMSRNIACIQRKSNMELQSLGEAGKRRYSHLLTESRPRVKNFIANNKPHRLVK